MNQFGFRLREWDNRIQPDEPGRGEVFDLRGLLAVLRRHLRGMILWALVGLAAGIAYLVTTPPRYYAASKVLVDEQLSRLTSEISSNDAAIRDDTALMNEIQVLQSQQLARAVIDDLALLSDPVALDEPVSGARRALNTVTAPVRALLPAPQGGTPDAPDTPKALRDRLALKLAGDVIVSPVGRSYVIEIGYMSHDPAFAARIANSYAEAYLADQLVANFTAKSRTAEWMQTRLDQLQAEAQAAALEVEAFKARHGLIADRDQTRERVLAEQKLAEVEARIASTGQTATPALQADLDAARAEVERITSAQVGLRELEQREATLTALFKDFSARREAIGIQESFPVSSVRILTNADVPKRPAAPKAARVLPLFAMLGLLAGLAIALRREFRERFFRTGEDVHAAGLPFLGYLPRLAIPRATRKDMASAQPALSTARGAAPHDRETWRPERAAPDLFAALTRPHSAYVETLRSLRIGAELALGADECRVVGILSVLPDEGKTMTAANLANLLACAGARTLLVDLDLRHPGLSEALGATSGAGVVQVLMGQASLDDAIRPVAATGLDVLPCLRSSLHGFASELLHLPRLSALLAEARGCYDHVILDLPPLGAVADARIVLPHLDGALLVTEWGRTPRDLVAQQVMRDAQVRAKVFGMVLNNVDMDDLPSYARIDGTETYAGVYADYRTEA